MEIPQSYSLEQINEVQNYEKACQMILSLINDSNIKVKAEAILFDGIYNGYTASDKVIIDSPGTECQRRLGLAYLLLRNPETFDFIVNNDIAYFHGTVATALPCILKYGVCSVDKLAEQGINVSTGEEWSRDHGKRDFISFTDSIDITRNYTISTKNNNDKLSFPVIIGTSKENLLSSSMRQVDSDVREVAVKDHFPKEKINCLITSPNHVKTIKKMVGDSIPILPMNDFNSRFYYFDSYSNQVLLGDDEYNKLKQGTFNGDKDDTLKGVKESVLGRTIKNIKDKTQMMSLLIKGDISSESRQSR